MIKLLILCCFSLAIFASDVVIGATEQQKDNTSVYTIQLFSSSNLKSAQKTLKKVPQALQNKTRLYNVGKYVACRYSQRLSYDEIKADLEKFSATDFNKSIIIKSTIGHMKVALIPDDKNNINNTSQNNTKNKTNKISKFDKSNLLLKAKSAYNKGSESETMIYYEMLLASGVTNQKIKNNLCYLYGKHGAWLEAKAIIESERYYGKLLYAYAYGAVESNQESYYFDLSPYIMIDKSGSLMLLSGYYFEKKEDMPRALSFYKMAYEKNPTDMYNIFSYARVLDIQQENQALSLYKNILSKVDNSHPLYATTHKRVMELGN